MGKITVAVALTRFPTKIEQAKSLLAKPAQLGLPDVNPALCVILLGVALEEAVRYRIAERVANAAPAGQSGEVYESIRSSSLRQRMTALAQIVGRGFFASPDRRTHARALHRLVTFRNELLHIAETVYVLDEQDEAIKFLGDGRIEVTVPIGEDPWGCVRVDDAKKCAQALDCYVKEVIEPLGDMGDYWTQEV